MGTRTLATETHPTPVTQPTFPTPNTLTCAYLPVAVVSAKKKTYFELFCVPVFPISSKHVWVCGICQWRVPLQQGYVLAFPPDPPVAFSDTWSSLHRAGGNHNSLDRGITTHPRYNGNRVRLPVNSSRVVPRVISPLNHKGILRQTSRTSFFRTHTRQFDPGEDEPVPATSRDTYACFPFTSNSFLYPLNDGLCQLYYEVCFPPMYSHSSCLNAASYDCSGALNMRAISGRALVPPGADPRPYIIGLLRFPRLPPQEPHEPNEPNDETEEHGNPVHHPALGTGFLLYLLGQRDSDRGVVVPAYFPEFSEGLVDVRS